MATEIARDSGVACADALAVGACEHLAQFVVITADGIYYLPLNKDEMATWYSQGAEGYTDYPMLV